KNLGEADCTQIEIEYSNDRYRVKVTTADWDVRVFEEALEVFSRTGSTEAGQKAMSLYRGEYLEGEDWPWSDLPREYYIRQYEQLSGVTGVNDPQRAKLKKK